MDVVIKKSKIHGNGVFAARGFSKGEVVLKWNPKPLNTSDGKQIPKKDLKYAMKIDGWYFLMQSPEKYVNSSCNPNTFVKDGSDVALRNIEIGEEITSNYDGDLEKFECNCGDEKCKKSPLSSAQAKNFNFRAKVVRGAGRGKGMGFPTANLDATDVDLGHGVYLVEVQFLGKKHKGLLFFGPKQTFGEPVSLEIFIKDLASDIYGETVAVRVIKKIRDIKKFDNPRELQKQIERDVAENLS